MSSSKLKNEISVMLLDEPMSLKEIAEEMEIKEKKTYTLLKSMFTDERITSFRDEDGQRKYRLTEEEAEKALKRKERAEKKASKQT
jgi:predicted transcriptional regulator